MNKVLIFILLSGCANVQDNTTVTDKIIIATTLSVILYGGTHLDQW